MRPSRRDFLRRTGGLGSAAFGLGRASRSVSATEGGPAPLARRGNPIGVSTYSFWQFRGERLGIEDCIDKAAAMGFDGVEVLHVQMRDESNGAIQKIKRQAHSLGLALLGFSTHQGFVSPDADLRSTNVQKTLYQIDLAYRLGIPTMRLNTGRWGTIQSFDDFMAKKGIEPAPEGHTDEEAFGWVIGSIVLGPSELARREDAAFAMLRSNREETEKLQARMIALQEELDWLGYRLYGLADVDDRSLEWPMAEGEPPGLALGERAFEIVMARQMAAGELQTSWFARHGSTPITEIPGHWPEPYRALVARRIEAIRNNPNITLIEKPEYKRRWNREPWDDQVKRALRSWLLDRLESPRYWPDPAHGTPELVSRAALANVAAQDDEFQQVAALYAGRPDFDPARLVEDLVASESVPFLPVLRYKPSGLTKRAVWERVWRMQEEEDKGQRTEDKDGPIPVPPKYASADFVSGDVWRLRGKLDVPKERFVSYPRCERDGDPSLVVGWAGWDLLRQAQALASSYDRMKTRAGWPADRLAPLLAGLDQLVFWLKLWHNEVDPEYDLRMGDYYEQFVKDEAHGLGYTLEQVRGWTPPSKAKGGRGRKKG